jgi:hypothetical protein
MKSPGDRAFHLLKRLNQGRGYVFGDQENYICNMEGQDEKSGVHKVTILLLFLIFFIAVFAKVVFF